MLSQKIEFAVTPEMESFLYKQVEELDWSMGQVLRGLVTSEMKRKRSAKTPNRADEQLVARLQRLLVTAMADALDWRDLQRRLAGLNHCIKPAGGGLAIHDLTTNERLCKSSELGFAYSRFVRKFRAPMPGHPHKMAHVLAAIRDVPLDDADGFGVIERFEVIERFSPFSDTGRQGFPRSEPH